MQSRPNRRQFLRTTTFGIASSGMLAQSAAAPAQPNVVIIFLDDSGFADFRPFGKPAYPTPNVERLAKQSCSFHNFYVPSAVCSASRSALLTGCYPGRTKVFGAYGPRARGLDPKFATLGGMLKSAGYRTAVFGKWHVGDQPGTRPPERGFDESCGLMYSNDMWEFHPENPQAYSKYPLQFWENGKVKVERVTPQHQTMLTTWYTEHAVDFIRRSSGSPFFLYVPHSMPHVPLHCSDKFKGKSGAGLYADIMMELDWSVGEILKALKSAGVEENTMVVFTSDNGPWSYYGNHAGKTPFRESKGTSFDGGTRSACIIRYPGRIRGGIVSTRTFCSVDLLPTISHLSGAPLPENEIDGKNVWDLISGKQGAENPHDYYPFYTGANFDGVLSSDGRWKLHLPHAYRTIAVVGADGKAGKYGEARIELSLFDLQNDPMESSNVIGRFPEVASRLKTYADTHRKQFFEPA